VEKVLAKNGKLFSNNNRSIYESHKKKLYKESGTGKFLW